MKHLDNPSPHFNDAKMVRFCSLTPSSLLWGDVGISFHFILSKIVALWGWARMSMSEQDESNPSLWLATREGKMELSCPLGTTRRASQENFPRTYAINLYWPSLFCHDGWILVWIDVMNRKTCNLRKRFYLYFICFVRHFRPSFWFRNMYYDIHYHVIL